ncbi:MAG: hypothetical protein ACK5HP_00025 [Bacilli bacterium]
MLDEKNELLYKPTIDLLEEYKEYYNNKEQIQNYSKILVKRR